MPTRSAEEVLIDRICNYYSDGEEWRNIWPHTGAGRTARDLWLDSLPGDLVPLITEAIPGHYHDGHDGIKERYRGEDPNTKLRFAVDKAAERRGGPAGAQDRIYRQIVDRLRRWIGWVCDHCFGEGWDWGWVKGWVVGWAAGYQAGVGGQGPTVPPAPNPEPRPPRPTVKHDSY